MVGSSLRNLIIARLPFPVPTDPINEARSEAMTIAMTASHTKESLTVRLANEKRGVKTVSAIRIMTYTITLVVRGAIRLMDADGE